MSASYGQIKRKIKLVIDDLQIQSKSNTAIIAKKFDILYSKL